MMNHIQLEPNEDFDLPVADIVENKYGLMCGGGRSSFAIKYDGIMCPCLLLDEVTAKPVEIGFEAAWKQIYYLANRFQVPAECDGCFLRTKCPSCAAMHRNADNIGHCDKRICERTKELIVNGFLKMPSRVENIK